MRQTLVDQYGKPLLSERQSAVITERLNSLMRTRQSYDAAGYGDEHKNYWSAADALDADSANSGPVRRTLTKRSRYEVGSNGFYAGIMETHVNMLVGVGPKLRMLTGNKKLNQAVEESFGRWWDAVMMSQKLWCMAHARTQDGEVFAEMSNDSSVGKLAVQLDISLIEADQCQTPQLPMFETGYIDGIRYDKRGKILWYDVLPFHPGSAKNTFAYKDPIHISANNILHWFKMKRPGQHRGIPALTATLNTGAAARRWREATLAAAETAADFTLFMKTQSMPDNFAEVAGPNAMDTFEIQKRMMVALPDGYDPFQLKSEYPTASYESFHRALVSEMARPLSIPFNVAAMDSSTYSFASGKLDTLAYRASLNVERQDCNQRVLDPLFARWFSEWTILSDKSFTPSHQWDWPAHPVIDATAEAQADDIQLRNGTKTLRQVYSDKGMDLEDQLVVMAEDYFGEASDENIVKMRDILLRTHYTIAIQSIQAEQQAQQQQAADAQQQAADAQAPEQTGNGIVDPATIPEFAPTNGAPTNGKAKPNFDDMMASLFSAPAA